MPSTKRTSDFTEAIAKVGTEPLVILLTVLSIVGSLAYSAVFAPGNVPNNVIRDTVLPGLICVVLILVLLQQFLIKTRVDESLEGVLPGGTILHPPHSRVSQEIAAVIAEPSAHSISVICYGTNKLNKVLDQVMTEKKISAQVVICSDKCKAVPDDADRRDLRRVYKELSKAKVQVFRSRILPTIRAVVIRTKDEEPIWCYMQPYHIHQTPRGMRGESFSPAIIADDAGSELMKELSKYITREFNRLKEASDQVGDEVEVEDETGP